MTTELKIMSKVDESQVMFFVNSDFLNTAEISMQDDKEKNFVSLNIEKYEAKQIISFLQNHFNL